MKTKQKIAQETNFRLLRIKGAEAQLKNICAELNTHFPKEHQEFINLLVSLNTAQGKFELERCK